MLQENCKRAVMRFFVKKIVLPMITDQKYWRSRAIELLWGLPSHVREDVMKENGGERTRFLSQFWSTAESNADKPSMEWLWSFKSSVTVGRNVSDMKFNPANGDILAVAYGQYEFSLERTDFDIEGAEAKLEKAKNLYKSLTCVEFSGNAPIVVVGSADGTVGCYRVKGLDILPLSDQEQFSKIRKVVCLMR